MEMIFSSIWFVRSKQYCKFFRIWNSLRRNGTADWSQSELLKSTPFKWSWFCDRCYWIVTKVEDLHWRFSTFDKQEKRNRYQKFVRNKKSVSKIYKICIKKESKSLKYYKYLQMDSNDTKKYGEGEEIEFEQFLSLEHTQRRASWGSSLQYPLASSELWCNAISMNGSDTNQTKVTAKRSTSTENIWNRIIQYVIEVNKESKRLLQRESFIERRSIELFRLRSMCVCVCLYIDSIYLYSQPHCTSFLFISQFFVNVLWDIIFSVDINVWNEAISTVVTMKFTDNCCEMWKNSRS
jgi:hypothetical protein